MTLSQSTSPKSACLPGQRGSSSSGTKKSRSPSSRQRRGTPRQQQDSRQRQRCQLENQNFQEETGPADSPISPPIHKDEKELPKSGSFDKAETVTVRTAKHSKKRPAGANTFMDYDCLSQRLKKTMYFANKLPATTRPSFPLTMLAVNAFTSGSLGTAHLNSLEFLDLEMASEIGRNACVSPTALIMALVYLDRLSSHNPDYLTSVKPSELFVVALLVASKFIQDEGEDNCIYNDEWAASAKMETKEINRLEIKFLTALDWRVNVTSDEFNGVLQKIEVNLAMDQGNSRGWFTYTEMEMMSESVVTWKLIWPTLYHYAVQVITAATLTYTAILTTLFSSAILAPQVYTISRAFLASTSVIQGSGYFGLGLGPNSIGMAGHCIDMNNTVPYSSEELMSNLSFDELDLDEFDLELFEKSRNESDLKLPYYFHYANVNQKYFQPNTYRQNIISHSQNVARRTNELKWKRQAPPTHKDTPMDLPIVSVFKLKAIAT